MGTLMRAGLMVLLWLGMSLAFVFLGYTILEIISEWVVSLTATGTPWPIPSDLPLNYIPACD
jgi:hypothetical protein